MNMEYLNVVEFDNRLKFQQFINIIRVQNIVKLTVSKGYYAIVYKEII